MEREAITELLLAYGQGIPGALDRLLEVLYPELRRVARRQLSTIGRAGDPVLDTGVVVQETYLKLVDGTRVSWRDRGHFLAVAARAMRQVIVDHARARRSQKRGDGIVHMPLDGQEAAIVEDADRILAVNEALERLGDADARMLKVVECRFFAGFTEAETAEALSVSEKTVEREWRRAKAWLRSSIGQ